MDNQGAAQEKPARIADRTLVSQIEQDLNRAKAMLAVSACALLGGAADVGNEVAEVLISIEETLDRVTAKFVAALSCERGHSGRTLSGTAIPAGEVGRD